MSSSMPVTLFHQFDSLIQAYKSNPQCQTVSREVLGLQLAVQQHLDKLQSEKETERKIGLEVQTTSINTIGEHLNQLVIQKQKQVEKQEQTKEELQKIHLLKEQFHQQEIVFTNHQHQIQELNQLVDQQQKQLKEQQIINEQQQKQIEQIESSNKYQQQKFDQQQNMINQQQKTMNQLETNNQRKQQFLSACVFILFVILITFFSRQ